MSMSAEERGHAARLVPAREELGGRFAEEAAHIGSGEGESCQVNG